MTWDAYAALTVVAGAIALLFWNFRREKRVCAKCEVVDAQKRLHAAGVTKRAVTALKIGRPKTS